MAVDSILQATFQRELQSPTPCFQHVQPRQLRHGVNVSCSVDPRTLTTKPVQRQRRVIGQFTPKRRRPVNQRLGLVAPYTRLTDPSHPQFLITVCQQQNSLAGQFTVIKFNCDVYAVPSAVFTQPFRHPEVIRNLVNQKDTNVTKLTIIGYTCLRYIRSLTGFCVYQTHPKQDPKSTDPYRLGAGHRGRALATATFGPDQCQVV